MNYIIKSGIIGLAIADAMGVPVEFNIREDLKNNPVTGMRGYGTFNQPPGTWSDDTSMTLCLLDSLSVGRIDYKDIMDKFIQWKNRGQYSPFDEMFDIGTVTAKALAKYEEGIEALQCGGKKEYDKGNGSLMRILPIAFYLYKKFGCRNNSQEKFEIIHNVSSLTHAQPCSLIGCGIYVNTAMYLLDGYEVELAVKKSIFESVNFYQDKSEYNIELKNFSRLIDKDFIETPEEKIKSFGYVVDTLEAAIWCLLNTTNYKDCVLKAVNLGEDTDTVAAVAGGLAGIAYGIDSFPKEWLDLLVKKTYIEELCEKFSEMINNL